MDGGLGHLHTVQSKLLKNRREEEIIALKLGTTRTCLEKEKVH